jgi:acyl-coenzyme A thioesterase PaaI-like protein
MEQKAFQDYYSEFASHCYGCGRFNDAGMQIKSYWDGEETVCEFQPKFYHTGLPGYVYGGLIASLIDCHSTGSAAAAAHKVEGREMGTEPALRFVTAALHVEYIHPTPLAGPLHLRSTFKEIKERKVIVLTELSESGKVCATGEVVCVRTPEHLLPSSPDKEGGHSP